MCEAVALLNVDEQTIRRWIDAESISYTKLPGGRCRVPRGAMLSWLRRNYDFAAELRELDERNVELTDEQVQVQLTDK